MRDDVDLAQGTIDALTDAAIRNIRNNAQRGLKPTGYCYYCESDVQSSKLFCDIACSQDYEQEQRLRKLAGRA
jgi:hypothetical protein